MGESLYGFKQQITVAAAIFTPRRQKLVWALTAELSIDCMRGKQAKSHQDWADG